MREIGLCAIASHRQPAVPLHTHDPAAPLDGEKATWASQESLMVETAPSEGCFVQVPKAPPKPRGVR